MPTLVICAFNDVNGSESARHFWIRMHYAAGLRELGCDVYWMERFRGSGDDMADANRILPLLLRLDRFGFGGRTIFYADAQPGDAAGLPARYFGLSCEEAEAHFDRADLLLNFDASIAPALHARFKRTALVDMDPGHPQFQLSHGHLVSPRHDFYFTTRETTGTPAALVPGIGLKWNSIRPPVCLTHWPFTFDPHAEAFTTVCYRDADDWAMIEREICKSSTGVPLLKFAALTGLTDQTLELALLMDRGRETPAHPERIWTDWRVLFSRDVGSTPEQYRRYIQQSRGEFSCAPCPSLNPPDSGMSDRTLCYLASGKPAIVPDAGESSFPPNGEGLFRFTTLRGAAEALEMVNADYERHCRAARRIAETYFDSHPVLKKLLSRALN